MPVQGFHLEIVPRADRSEVGVGRPTCRHPQHEVQAGGDRLHPDRIAPAVRSTAASKPAADAGLDRAVIDQVRIRVSQLNGCAYCTDSHSTEAIEAGEQPRRI